ncbi:hypothetical protein [Kitasatospora purpeofusca]|uniref:hypothetical protein n=1 Tax=Kitasatospora purpeofusca TaxID=67352 RepID=UPI0004BE4BA2|nr:hypothetical protein [Kitasatospora purpeofusca]
MEAEPAPAAARSGLPAAYERARETGDAELMAAAALDLPSGQRFGVHPGRVPALIHEAYAAAVTPVSRCRLAAALARAWVYGGNARRATAFAQEAVALADGLDDPEVLAEALDAALVARWGPDDFAERLALSARLADTTAHLTDPEARLTGHLWQLTTAWECLDLVAVQRQLRALDTLAEESGRPRHAFFAASRRAALALVQGDTELADRLLARTRELGARAAEPDLEAVVHDLRAARARRAGDTAALRREAAAFEEFGAAEGVPSVSAEASVLWLAAGAEGRARQLLDRLAGTGFGTVTRDVDFLLTVACLTEVAAALRCDELADDGARLLAPFAGRAVLNGGAVTFHGVVDDYLHLVGTALALPGAADARRAAAAAYRRIGATWWLNRLAVPAPTPAPRARTVHLHPADESGWLVGDEGSAFLLPRLRGLDHLRTLLGRPGVEVSALELSAAAPGRAGTAVMGAVVDSETAEIADRQALAAYRARLRDIDAELDDAASWADRGRTDRLRLEREALLHELRAATGLGGRPRRFSSTDERARVAVRKAVVSALDRVAARDSTLAGLLRDTVHTGASCRYDPDPARPVTWLLDPPDVAGGDAPRPIV